MKYYLLGLGMLSVSISPLMAQNDTLEYHLKDIQMDLLQTPSNPAFLIMGTNPTEIATPASTSAFYTSIQNVSNDFSAFPNNFAFSITPYWWSKKAETLSFEEDFSEQNTFTFWKTTTLSAGIVSGVGSQPDLWRYALGFKSTLLRGKVNPDHKKAFLDELRTYHETYYGDINAFFAANGNYTQLQQAIRALRESVRQIDQQLTSGHITAATAQSQKQVIIGELTEKNNALDSLRTKLSRDFNHQKQYTQSTKALDKQLNRLQKREGFKWDIGGGIAFNSTNNQINQTQLYRLGLWSNAGSDLYTRPNQNFRLSGFVLARFLYFSNMMYTREETPITIDNLGAFDFGGKLQLEVGDRFAFGMEMVYRSAAGHDFYSNTYKVNGLMQYTFDNKSIYASFGNAMNERSDQGPEEFMVTFGCNIGIGGNIDLKEIRLNP